MGTEKKRWDEGNVKKGKGGRKGGRGRKRINPKRERDNKYILNRY